LVLMFRFLWVSVGPTCSASWVNAKDSSSSISDGNYYFKVSSVVYFRWKLLFMYDLVLHSWITFCVSSSGSKCTCWVFSLTLVFIWFLGTKSLRHAWELGVAPPSWAQTFTYLNFTLNLISFATVIV
jgi:hypothetical protein